MKGNYIWVCAIVFLCLSAVSCDKDESRPAPSLTVSSVISASSEGGNYSLTYTVENPVEGGGIECVGDVSWLSDFDTSVEGIVGFWVAENPEPAARSGNITVTYAYPGGYAQKKLGVSQNGTETPVLTVQSNSVTVYANGGVSSFTYNIDNPAEDGELFCESSETWVDGFDCSEYGTVRFTVDRYNGESIRSCEVAVIYRYGSSNTAVKTVLVVQDYVFSGTGADVSDVIGTYTVSGTILDPEDETGTRLIDTTWTMNIFAYTGTGKYDLYIDGLTRGFAGAYDYYGDHRCSEVAQYSDGTIVIPSQVLGETTIVLGNASYYLGFTPCISYTSAGFTYNSNWPPLTFTRESDGTWKSDYGALSVGCTGIDISTIYYLVDAVVPYMTLTKE